MKSHFFAYIRPNTEEFQNLWDNGLFTIDTNILLNLYRYKDDTRTEFFNLFKKISDRLFLTNHVGEEYFNNRLDVILEQVKSYSELDINMDKYILNPLKNNSRHPRIPNELLTELEQVFEKVSKAIVLNKKELDNRAKDDEVLNEIISVFDGKVNEPFNDEKINDIYKAGETRYAKKQPPGYKDRNKEDNKFGDLIVWEQIIEEASTKKKDIIFVTDDQKEDWWIEKNGATIGPHPLLLSEFFTRTGHRIYFYTADSFYKYSSDFYKTKVKEEVIQDVVDVREQLIINQQIAEAIQTRRRFSYEIISEEEMLSQLIKFKEQIGKTNGYVGLKKFVTEYLAEQEYEINHSYAIVNKLEEKGEVVIKTIMDDMLGYNVKVIDVSDIIRPTHQS